MATWKQIISEKTEKGYSLNEIAKYVEGYSELLSEIARGLKRTNGELKRPPLKWHGKLLNLHAETRHLEKNEHKYGKARDWQLIIKTIMRRGFSHQHIADIVHCRNTHIRDVISSYNRKIGKKLVPKISIQGKLLQLYEETEGWPDNRIHKGNSRVHGNITMVSTVGAGWQCD